jgi:hypothetical protein
MSLAFQPFSSAADLSFWHALSSKKIDELKLDARAVPLVEAALAQERDRLLATA